MQYQKLYFKKFCKQQNRQCFIDQGNSFHLKIANFQFKNVLTFTNIQEQIERITYVTKIFILNSK